MTVLLNVATLALLGVGVALVIIGIKGDWTGDRMIDLKGLNGGELKELVSAAQQELYDRQCKHRLPGMPVCVNGNNDHTVHEGYVYRNKDEYHVTWTEISG